MYFPFLGSEIRFTVHLWSLLFHWFVKRSVLLKNLLKTNWFEDNWDNTSFRSHVPMWTHYFIAWYLALYKPIIMDPLVLKILCTILLPKIKIKYMEQLNEHRLNVFDSFRLDNRTQSNSYLMVNSITALIVPMRKLLIMIGSPCAYLLCNRHVITWMSNNYRYPLHTFCNWIPTWFTCQ